ncbi:MAG: hypothetical protein Q8K68_11625, partial [Nitrospirota bacterium]|nr:hypothetical protein [Nitrospirota bacterium]
MKATEFIKRIPLAIVAPIRNMRMRNKLWLLSLIVLIGLAASLLSSFFLLSRVRIGSEIYVKIRTNRDLLEKIAIQASKLNNYRAEIAIVIDEADADKTKQILARMDTL